MCRDIQISLLTGQLITTPSIIKTKGGKNFLTFKILNKETFTYADQKQGCHNNIFDVEILGENHIAKYSSMLKIDSRWHFTGYWRHDSIDGKDRIRFRVYNIQSVE